MNWFDAGALGSGISLRPNNSAVLGCDAGCELGPAASPEMASKNVKVAVKYGKVRRWYSKPTSEPRESFSNF